MLSLKFQWSSRPCWDRAAGTVAQWMAHAGQAERVSLSTRSHSVFWRTVDDPFSLMAST